MTTKARFAVILIALVFGGYCVYEKIYEIAAALALIICLLIWSHFKQGTVMLASKAYQQKNFVVAEKLLKEIKHPNQLSKKRRGFYEFMLGNIALQNSKTDIAERHFQLATRFPLRTENDKALILVQLANINLQKEHFDRARAYTDAAKGLKITARVQEIINKIEQQLPKTS